MKQPSAVRRRASRIERLCLGPYSAWAVLFIVVPLIFVAYYAFTDLDFRFTTDNITRFFTAVSTVTDESGATREVRTYLLIFFRSLVVISLSPSKSLYFRSPGTIVLPAMVV